MDLDSEGERLEPFDAAVVSSRRAIRNPISRCFHCTQILPLVFILALSITSLSYFAVTDEKIGDVDLPHGKGKCVLYTRYNEDVKGLDLSSGHACVFSIFGEVAVAVLAAFLIVWVIIKTTVGFHMSVSISLALCCVCIAFTLYSTMAAGGGV